MLHTLAEAIALTGKSRRTLYNHCDQGRISYSVGPDGRRYFETSELIRVYGALHTPEGIAHPEPAQVCTPPVAHPDAPMTEATALRLVAVMEKLIELQERQLLLEHKPSKVDVNRQDDQAKPTGGQKPPSVSVQSFADLLKSLD
ncbi:helix-turn-helix domain-containing protein [Pseudomonas luteola]|nr:helix-turn-helix domain-containing protein [Pseudomonas luteola]